MSGKTYEVTNPCLEFLCIFSEETGDLYISQFHKPRSKSIQLYFEQWANQPDRKKTLRGNYCACIKAQELDGGWLVVEEGFFKMQPPEN